MKSLLQEVLKENQIESNKIVNSTVEKLTDNAKIYELSKSIKNLKSQILQIFTMHRDREEFRESYITIPNANVKKEYNFTFDLSKYPSIFIKEIKNIETVGLQFDTEKSCIHGIPTQANTIQIEIVFFNKNDENLQEDIKIIPFIVNADPKDLWLNKPSPKDSRFAKEDQATFKSTFLDKKIVVASKRGRSHAHEGTFRDDDFLVKNLPGDWAVVAVADGAGSARFARAGSQFATEFIVKSFDDESLLNKLSDAVAVYFSKEKEKNLVQESDIIIEDPNDSENSSTSNSSSDEKIKSKSLIINSLYHNVKNLHSGLSQLATEEGALIKDFHTTLIFTLVKKFNFGYVILSFGVGDCPINVLDKENSSVKLLNFLDVGESSGATRFITMPDIFSKPDMVERFKINCFNDFSKLFLMTDGIYDPKFVVESKLENLETWKNFLRDLNGENEDQTQVDFVDDSDIENQLSAWMDFWSKGNHDDRTLAVIY
ncbi:PP2C family serine/threonine-protein phosphatase [Chryseobacterium caseinilyticum]|uniref:Protein phosphatase 2C domain-containing protein n=1 Tax=Chryseobacterium caseinilyticum TaxID=2771428 RepID=A0ABR8Z9H3_9FLAO|nr:PP2C family serine/threonine-protein phosphatase [Chryseobacterium caseinilyticum]MBD8081876.1 protein phosphatase 2C domain-containing protein [Chryseobacterium caseinilyticum]